MPVPSTMTGFRLTVVGMPSGRVTSTTARIIGSGPTATTSSKWRPSASRALQGVGHQALLAVRPVVGGDDDLVDHRAQFLLEDDEVLRAAADDGHDVAVKRLDAARDRIDDGGADAAADAADLAAGVQSRSARPSGPARSRIASPSFIAFSWRVDLPTPWTMIEIAPRVLSTSAMVSGIRSPSSPVRMMTNWPGLRLRAMCGPSIQKRTTSGARTSLLRIRCTGQTPLLQAHATADGDCRESGGPV